MMRNCFHIVFAACALVTISACEDDPTSPPPPGSQAGQLDLTQKWHVLNNIEYAYKTRRPDVYDELVDQNFTFFFAPGDVGGNIPEQWGRPDELSATTALFNSNLQTGPPYDDPYCRSIRLDMQYDKDTMTWVEVVPDDFPNERWYVATVFYTFTFEVWPDITYIPQNGARAQFTVRNSGTDQQPRWELAEFRDLGGETTAKTSMATQAQTWGAVKALYR
jgi:hypothetical protein